MDFRNRLAALEPAIGSIKRVPRLPGDQWLLASGLQKAIRFGDVQRAAGFALSLAFVDRRMLHKRLCVVAFEDVGPGNPGLVIDVIAAFKSPLWRRRVGDTQVAVHLAKAMARSVKSRFLTEAIFLTDLGQEAASLRKKMPRLSNKTLASLTLDPHKPVHERFLALHALAGTKLYPAKGFSRAGDLEASCAVIRQLPGAPELAEACIGVLRDLRWPLALWMPLAVGMMGDCRVENERPLSAPEVEGVPVYAVDMYTRLGQTALRQLQRRVPALKGYSPAQLGEACFFIESECLAQRLTSDALAVFRLKSLEALMADLGLDWQGYKILERILIKHWDLYNELRLHQLERSLSGMREADLFAGKEDGCHG